MASTSTTGIWPYSCEISGIAGSCGITRNKLRTLTGTKYEFIDRYYKEGSVEMADLDFLSKVCFVLDCEASDLLEYQRPKILLAPT